MLSNDHIAVSHFSNRTYCHLLILALPFYSYVFGAWGFAICVFLGRAFGDLYDCVLGKSFLRFGAKEILGYRSCKV